MNYTEDTLLSPTQWILVTDGYIALTLLVRLPWTAKNVFIERRHGIFRESIGNCLARSYFALAIFNVISVIGFVLVQYFYIKNGDLSFSQISPHVEPVSWVGIALAIFSLVLLIWSHVSLGSSWSPVLNAKQDHKLKTKGIYKFARHPMYTSFLFQPVCVLLISQNWLLSIFWSVWIIFATVRINEEERLLIELFGGEYVNYKNAVGAFLPCKLCCGLDCGLSEEQCAEELEKWKKLTESDHQ